MEADGRTIWMDWRPVPPRQVEVRAPRQSLRTGTLVGWARRRDMPDGPWWGRVQFDGSAEVGYLRQDWLRPL